MLKKCLKYDFRATFRVWLILSIISISLYAVLGLSLAGTGSENVAINILSIFGIMPGYVAIFAYPIAIAIISAIRCYTSFFTDEGYLTFTLPVRRRTLLHSKLISAWCYMSATIAVLATGIAMIVGIQAIFPSENGLGSLVTFGLFSEIVNLVTECGFHGVMVLIMGVIAIFMLSITSMLWTYFCITFGAMLAKRLKLLAIIITFYISEMILSAILVCNILFGVIAFVSVGDYLSDSMSVGEKYAMVWLGLLCAIAVMAVISSLFYRFTVTKLERDLNLA